MSASPALTGRWQNKANSKSAGISKGTLGGSMTGRAFAARAAPATTSIPKDNADQDKIAGLDAAMADAVAYKFLPAPLAADQLKVLIQLQEPLK